MFSNDVGKMEEFSMCNNPIYLGQICAVKEIQYLLSVMFGNKETNKIKLQE